MTIKCSCGDPECKITIRFGDSPHILWLTDKEGKETLMYLDASTTVKLISELRSVLLGIWRKRPTCAH